MTEGQIPICYLIGSIDHAKDPTTAFDTAERVVTELGHTALNPVKQEPLKTGLSVDDSVVKGRELWRLGDFEGFKKLMEPIWEKDLENVRKSDYLVLHYESGEVIFGTALEMVYASRPYLDDIAKKSMDEKQKFHMEMSTWHSKKAGYTHKPIYWVCQGAIMPVNSTLKMLVMSASEVKVFKTYKDLGEHLQKEYGKFKVEEKK